MGPNLKTQIIQSMIATLPMGPSVRFFKEPLFCGIIQDNESHSTKGPLGEVPKENWPLGNKTVRAQGPQGVWLDIGIAGKIPNAPMGSDMCPFIYKKKQGE